MNKRHLFIAVLMGVSSARGGVLVKDDFSVGTAGRLSITNGALVGGTALQQGEGAWISPNAFRPVRFYQNENKDQVIAAIPGEGNGAGQLSAPFDLGSASGRVTAAVDVKFTDEMTAPWTGFYLSFTSETADSPLGSKTADSLTLRFDPISKYVQLRAGYSDQPDAAPVLVAGFGGAITVENFDPQNNVINLSLSYDAESGAATAEVSDAVLGGRKSWSVRLATALNVDNIDTVSLYFSSIDNSYAGTDYAWLDNFQIAVPDPDGLSDFGIQRIEKPENSPIHMGDMIQPVPRSSLLEQDGFTVWGASMTRSDDGVCHLFYARWPAGKTWLNGSEIACATANQPEGPYAFQEVILASRGDQFWDGIATINPQVHFFDGKYYLYYTGNNGAGRLTFDENGNPITQRIGVAVADHPAGPWSRPDVPLVDISESGLDSNFIANPAVTETPRGTFLLIYKCGDGSKVYHTVAEADSPDGPFVKSNQKVFDSDTSSFPAEDPFIWYQDDRFYAVLKDMDGSFSTGGVALVQFESFDGYDWNPSRPVFVSETAILWHDGVYEDVDLVERPQIWMQNGMPAVMFCAVRKGAQTYNIHIPLKKPETDPLMIPYPGISWSNAVPIVKNGEAFHSDFCLIQDRSSRWHAIGIGGPDGGDQSLFHAVGSVLTEPFDYRDQITSDSGTLHMWAPYAVWADRDNAYLYYCHATDSRVDLRMFVGRGPDLESWTPYAGDNLEGNTVFQEAADRDACIFWDDDLKTYLMYYAGNPDGLKGIRCRRSADLFNWTDPITVMTPPPGYQVAESPFVLKRNGYYYLWVSGFDYGRMSLYISRDPFDFGDSVANRIEEQPGHAPEIVTENEIDYIGCAAIASNFDAANSPAYHDLRGVFLQPLRWREATSAEVSRVTE